MAGSRPQTTMSQVRSDILDDKELIGHKESFSMSDTNKVSKLKEELKKAQKDLHAANMQAEFYKKTSEKFKEQMDLEYKARRAARRKCFKLKRMSTDLIEIISELASFLRARNGVGDDLEMLKEIPARLQSLFEVLEDAQSAEDLNDFDDALSEIMDRFKLLKSKLGGATGVAASSDVEGNPNVGEGEEGNDIVLTPAAVPLPPSNQVGDFSVRLVEGAANSGGRRTRNSKKGSEAGLGLSASLSSPSSGFRPETQEQQVMDIVEDGQAEAMVRMSHHPVTAYNKKHHGIYLGNIRQCVCGFTSKRSVRAHIRRLTFGRHIATGTHVCSNCGDRFVSRLGLQKHLARHKPKPGFRKAVPAVVQTETKDAANDGKSSTSVSLTSGTVTVPQKIPQSTNGRQSKAKRSVSNIAENHFEVESSSGYLCACGKRESTKIQLQTHIRSKTEDLKFTCPSCGKKFLFQCNLRTHCVSSHKMMTPAPVPSLRCRLCEEWFTTYTEFFDHQNTMHFQPK